MPDFNSWCGLTRKGDDGQKKPTPEVLDDIKTNYLQGRLLENNPQEARI